MRISDWSSDVCSSDLPHGIGERVARVGIGPQPAPPGAGPERGRVNRDKPVEPRFEIVKPHAFERRSQAGKTDDHDIYSLDGWELVAFSRRANLIDNRAHRMIFGFSDRPYSFIGSIGRASFWERGCQGV